MHPRGRAPIQLLCDSALPLFGVPSRAQHRLPTLVAQAALTLVGPASGLSSGSTPASPVQWSEMAGLTWQGGFTEE